MVVELSRIFIADYDRLASELETCRRELIRLERESQTLRETRRVVPPADETNAVVSQQLRELQQRHSKSLKELEETQSALTQTRGRLADVTDELAAQKLECSKLQSRVRSLEHPAPVSAQATGSPDRLRVELQKERERADRLESQLQQLQERIPALEREVLRLRKTASSTVLDLSFLYV